MLGSLLSQLTYDDQAHYVGFLLSQLTYDDQAHYAGFLLSQLTYDDQAHYAGFLLSQLTYDDQICQLAEQEPSGQIAFIQSLFTVQWPNRLELSFVNVLLLSTR